VACFGWFLETKSYNLYEVCGTNVLRADRGG